MEAQEFANWMGGIESIAVIVAIIVGGIWSAFVYRRLSERTRAQLSVLKLQEDIETAQLEQLQTAANYQKLIRESKVGPVIEIDISATQVKLPENPNLYVEAAVKITNKGNINTRLEYEDRKPFSVFRVDIVDNEPAYKDRVDYSVALSSSPNYTSPSMNVRAGGSEKIQFFFEVASAGLYLLVFTVPLSDDEQKRAKALGFTFPGRWSAKKYFVVNSTPPNRA